MSTRQKPQHKQSSGSAENVIRMQRALYGGDVISAEGHVRLPFVLSQEAVTLSNNGSLLDVVEISPDRTAPACPHFTHCGGCQYQMQRYEAQVETKQTILRDLLSEAGVEYVPAEIPHHTAEPYHYRNRIRLRIESVDDRLRLGYNVRASTEFLPVDECPIAAPALWQAAEALLCTAEANEETAAWLQAAREVEFFANDTLDKLQLTLHCPPRTRQPQGSFERAMRALSGQLPALAGAGAIAVDAKIGPTGKTLAEWGSSGLNYRVLDETYWVSRGGFFQVNRFLLPTLVGRVTAQRSGKLAWDLFAGVGLFSRVLAKSFSQLTAVESHPAAARDLAATLKKLGKQHLAVASTTLDFLRRAVMERDRPELVVLDPPRAGAGEEACELLARLKPATIVYLSCDPTTLARDWRVLERAGYRAASTELIDLFPQTFHMETLVTFVLKP